MERACSNAQRVAPVHVTGNYSYTCTRMTGPGWVMVGDAYAFVDPVFSSGVYLGMNSAEQAADVVDGALRDPSREAALQHAMVSAPQARPEALPVVHLPLHHAGHAAPVRQSAQRFGRWSRR